MNELEKQCQSCGSGSQFLSLEGVRVLSGVLEVQTGSEMDFLKAANLPHSWKGIYGCVIPALYSTLACAAVTSGSWPQRDKRQERCGKPII